MRCACAPDIHFEELVDHSLLVLFRQLFLQNVNLGEHVDVRQFEHQHRGERDCTNRQILRQNDPIMKAAVRGVTDRAKRTGISPSR